MSTSLGLCAPSPKSCKKLQKLTIFFFFLVILFFVLVGDYNDVKTVWRLISEWLENCLESKVCTLRPVVCSFRISQMLKQPKRKFMVWQGAMSRPRH